MCSPLSIVTHHLHGGALRLSVTGEVDMSNHDLLGAIIAGAVVDDAVRTVIVDLHAVAFLDAAGVRTLLAARQWAAERGTKLRVDRPRGLVERVLRLTGTLSVLTGGRSGRAAGPVAPAGRPRAGRRNAPAATTTQLLSGTPCG
jgi:anti-sigma B factor antagonist